MPEAHNRPSHYTGDSAGGTSELPTADSQAAGSAAVANRSRQQAHLLGKVLGGREVDGLANGHAQRGEELVRVLARPLACGEQLDVLEGQAGAPGAAIAAGCDEDVDAGARSAELIGAGVRYRHLHCALAWREGGRPGV